MVAERGSKVTSVTPFLPVCYCTNMPIAANMHLPTPGPYRITYLTDDLVLDSTYVRCHGRHNFELSEMTISRINRKYLVSVSLQD